MNLPVVIPASTVPSCSFADILGGTHSITRTLISPPLAHRLSVKSAISNSLPYLARQGLVEFNAVEAFRFRDVELRGADVIYQAGKPIFIDEAQPAYTVTYFPKNEVGGGGPSEKKEIIVDHPSFVITHWTSATYGHFLLEMLPKRELYT